MPKNGISKHTGKPKGPNGGAGRGQGRKVGAATAVTRDRANKILASGGTLPLDVMYENMLFWHQQSLGIGETIKQLLAGADSDEQRAEAIKLLKLFLNSREQAQSCAVDIAPFLHPKLSSISITGKNDGPVELITRAMSVSEAADIWAKTLQGGDVEEK